MPRTTYDTRNILKVVWNDQNSCTVTNHVPDKTLFPYIMYIMKATTQAPPYTDGALWKCETAVTATSKAILIVDKMAAEFMKSSCSRVNM